MPVLEYNPRHFEDLRAFVDLVGIPLGLLHRELLLVVALATVAGLFFMGNWAISILYKNPAFLQAFPVLRIIVWSLILHVFTSVLGKFSWPAIAIKSTCAL